MPENFAIKTQAFKEQKHPELAYDKNGVKVWRQASQKFAEQPKGLVEVYINTQPGLNDIKAEVQYSTKSVKYRSSNRRYERKLSTE